MDWQHVTNLIAPALIGMAGLAVRFIANMAKSLNDISMKMSQFHDILRDHEQRLRVVEKHHD